MIEKSDISLLGSVILNVPEWNFARNLWLSGTIKDHQLFLIAFKAACKMLGYTWQDNKKFQKNRILANISYINQYFHKLWFLEPALTDIKVSWWFLLVIRVIYDECKFSFWYTEVSAYQVHNLVYLCRSLLEQQIELVLKQKIGAETS